MKPHIFSIASTLPGDCTTVLDCGFSGEKIRLKFSCFSIFLCLRPSPSQRRFSRLRQHISFGVLIGQFKSAFAHKKKTFLLEGGSITQRFTTAPDPLGQLVVFTEAIALPFVGFKTATMFSKVKRPLEDHGSDQGRKNLLIVLSNLLGF